MCSEVALRQISKALLTSKPVASSILGVRKWLAAGLLLIVACSREEPAPTIPGADDVVPVPTTATPAVTTTVDVRISFEEATLRFSACMREEGIDLPDIRLDSEGRPQLGNLSEEVDLADPAFSAAFNACAPILTEAGALDLGADPELQAVIIDQLQQFSECMREEGITAFPDPVPGFTGQGAPYPLHQIPFSAPGFAQAIEACQDEFTVPDLGS